MAITNFNHRELIYIFGILGNIVSFGVFLSPMPTFWRIYKKKSTEGFQALPYSVALFSATLLLYYAMIKKDDATLIITINIIGFVIELFYLSVFLIYAPKWARAYTLRLLGLLNVTCLAMIIFTTLVFTHGDDEHTLLSKGGVRESTVGWICAVFSVCVFAAPLSVMRMVIRTQSAEFMPFWLSFSLTLCAVMWFFYGFLIKDFYIAFPNILGFILGITQMILYIIYKGSSTTKQPNDLVIDIKLGNVAKINQELTLENKENVAQEVIEIIVQELEILEEKSEENSNNSNNNDNDNEKNDKVANIGDIIVADMSRTESNV